ARETGRADPARARASPSLAARRVALQDGAPGFVRGRDEGRAPARLAAAPLESRGPDRDVRLVSRQPRSCPGRRRDASRAVEPAGARAPEEDFLMLVL